MHEWKTSILFYFTLHNSKTNTRSTAIVTVVTVFWNENEKIQWKVVAILWFYPFFASVKCSPAKRKMFISIFNFYMHSIISFELHTIKCIYVYILECTYENKNINHLFGNEKIKIKLFIAFFPLEVEIQWNNKNNWTRWYYYFIHYRFLYSNSIFSIFFKEEEQLFPLCAFSLLLLFLL